MDELKNLFHRDLNRLIAELEEVPDELIWNTKPGITNSCGVLAQHIAGNLRHFIGSALGGTGYERDRQREFTNTGASTQQLVRDLEDTRDMISEVLPGIRHDQLKEAYPLPLPWEATVQEFLWHLYGHLNYHLGQVNYLGRILDENKG